MSQFQFQRDFTEESERKSHNLKRKRERSNQRKGDKMKATP